MYSSRWISWFMLIALCLAPLHGGGQAWANRIVPPQVIQAPANIPVQDSAAVLAPLTPSRECRLSPGRITRTSVGRNGMQANGYSSFSDISADGRFVAFESFSNNLVEGDTNDHEDIFVFDRTTGQTELVSVASNGSQGDQNSSQPSISADGRFVAFESMAYNLVEGDTVGVDVFVHDRQTGETQRVSVASDGTQGNASMYYTPYPSISGDGRFVIFTSGASNLVSGDTNGFPDVFIHDRQSGETTRLSVASDGTQGNEESSFGAISADGRFVAFSSLASNLVAGDTNQAWDIFVRDRQSGETQRVSVASNGTPGNGGSYGDLSISADGRFVVFNSRANNLVDADWNELGDLFVHDRQTGETQRVSVASDGMQSNSDSTHPSISHDGRFVVFQSEATSLISGDIYHLNQIYIHDRLSKITQRVSAAPDGTRSNNSSGFPSISADGRFVAFGSASSNLVSDDTNGKGDIFVYERRTVLPDFSASLVYDFGSLTVSFTNKTVDPFTSSLWDFGDGNTSPLTSPTHTYDIPDIYTVSLEVSDAEWSSTLVCPSYVRFYDPMGDPARASLASDGTQGNESSSNPSISAFGRFVAFESWANNLVSNDTNANADIFVHDRQSRETVLVSVASDGTQGYLGSFSPSISYDGRYVAFASESSNLVSHDTNQAMDIFVHDLLSGGTQRISVATDGTQADGDSSDPALSADGRFVAFASYASNLVEGDTNGTVDVFVHDRLRHQTQLISVASDSSPGNNDSFSPAISADGRYVAFTSWANNLVGDDTNHQVDVFVHDRQTGQTGRISLASDGTQGNNRSSSPTVSADGRFVAFVSRSNNLVSGDTNQAEDIFVHDRQSGITQRVSLASDGSQGNGLSEHPTISADGRFVAFKSDASNLVSADTNLISDVFVHNRQSGQTRLASLVTNRTQGNGNSDWPAISADGLHLTFESAASNLVSDDTNGFKDIFFQEWGTQEPTNVHADFIASPLSGVDSLTVTFTNHISGEFTTSLWFFGDGETNLQPSPTHTYTAPGVYNVTLFASGPGGTDSLTRNAYIVVRGPRSHYLPLVTR